MDVNQFRIRVLGVTQSLQRVSRKVYGVNMDTDVDTEPVGEDFVLDPCSSSSGDNSSDVEFTEESDNEGGIVLVPRSSREQHERVKHACKHIDTKLVSMMQAYLQLKHASI